MANIQKPFDIFLIKIFDFLRNPFLGMSKIKNLKVISMSYE
jgi:hypothetical protein